MTHMYSLTKQAVEVIGGFLEMTQKLGGWEIRDSGICLVIPAKPNSYGPNDNDFLVLTFAEIFYLDTGCEHPDKMETGNQCNQGFDFTFDYSYLER